MTIGSEEIKNKLSDFEIAWSNMFPGIPLPDQHKVLSQIGTFMNLVAANRPTVDQISATKEEGFLYKYDFTPEKLKQLAVFFNGRSVEPYPRLFGNNLIRQLLDENERFGGAVKLNYFGTDTLIENNQRRKGQIVQKDLHNFQVTAIGILNKYNQPTSMILYSQGTGGAKDFTPLIKLGLPVKV